MCHVNEIDDNFGNISPRVDTILMPNGQRAVPCVVTYTCVGLILSPPSFLMETHSMIYLHPTIVLVYMDIYSSSWYIWGENTS